jgi:ribosomal protein S18 acetylase RimI-like enzyme
MMASGGRVRCDDWRGLSARDVVPLLDAEARCWRDRLGWDVTGSWRAIEPARAAGRLPGFVARDATGRPAGWTFFLEHHGSLQVAALVGDTPDAVDALVDAILSSDVASRTSACVWCVRAAAPGLAAALGACGADVTRYLYLSAPARRGVVARLPESRAWRDGDEPHVAALFARAYGAAGGLRAFAPNDTREEWRDYVHSLRHSPGCGRFLPEASLIAAGDDAAVAAATVVTAVAPETAHLAQIVVDPAVQRQGWGQRLAGHALRSAGALGYARFTLLVAEDNAAARALYGRLGFVEQEAFVVAVARQPRRLSSVALASGGASTRR